MELSNTLKYINLGGLVIGLVVFRGPMYLCVCINEDRGDGEGLVVPPDVRPSGGVGLTSDA